MKAKTRRAIERAGKLFRGFRLRGPREVREVRFDLPEAVILMGELAAVEYVMPHGQRSVLYRHEFAKGSRPDLGAGPDRCQLVILGGHYRVTHRGIVDLTPGGRERE